MTIRENCPRCGLSQEVVHVHGHGQCAVCGANVEPCCSGGSAGDEAGAVQDVAAGPDPELFARLFERLGGVTATVTTESLLFAVAQHLGSDLDEARLVVEAAERVGVVVRQGTSLHRLRRP